MFKKLLLIAVLLLAATDAIAARPRQQRQWLFGSTNEPPVASVRYYALQGTGRAYPTSNPLERAVPWEAGIFSGLFCRSAVDFTSDFGPPGASMTLTLMVNGSATALSTTITGTSGVDQECIGNTTDSITISDGDLVEMRLETVGSPDPLSRFKWNLRFVPDVKDRFLYPTTAIQTVTQYIESFGPLRPPGTTEPNARFLVPINGTFVRLMAAVPDPRPSGSATFTFYKSGVSVGSVTLGTGATLSSQTLNIPVVAGDNFSLGVVASGSNQIAGVNLVFVPETSGHYFLSQGNQDTIGNVVRYASLIGNKPWDSTTYNAHPYPLSRPGTPLLTVKGLMAQLLEVPVPMGSGWDIGLVTWETPSGPSTPPLIHINSCTIDTSCSSAPCQCSVAFDYVPEWNSYGTHLYEFEAVPFGNPSNSPEILTSLHVAQ